jgi:hypothetical protein
VSIVNEAVEDRVGIGRVADEPMPFVDRDLAGKDRRAAPVTLLEDFVEITTGAGVERFQTPIVEDQELDTGKASQDASIAAVAAGERELGEQLGDALVENRAVITASLVTERTGKPTFADPGRNSVILPGVRLLRFGSAIRFIRAAAKRSQCSVQRCMLALNTLSSGNPIGHWRYCRRG